jgi:hypothetical protein
MSERLLDARRATAAAGMKALHDDGLTHISLGNNQRIDIEIVVVLGVCDRRFKRLLDGRGDALARKLKLGQRLVNLLAADESSDQVELLRADAKRAGDCLRFVGP